MAGGVLRQGDGTVSLLLKVRGLWRFDGDVEPVRVSRRRFLFMGGVVAAGLVVPGNRILATVTGSSTTIELDSMTLHRLFRETYREVVPRLFEDYSPAWVALLEEGSQ